jgi:hypothetical protein
MNINNIDPSIWGPSLWKSLHYITIAYPDNPTNIDKQNMKLFFGSIGQILPCEKCRLNFSRHLVIYPLTDEVLSSRFDLVNWLINVHNEVNKMNGKKVLSYDEVMDIYLYKNTDNCLIVNSRLAVITVSIVIIILLVVILRCLDK